MALYKFADANGNIVLEDYDPSTTLTASGVMKSITNAFNLFPYTVNISNFNNENELYLVEYPNKEMNDVYICAKATTPGGRAGLIDEQRIQPKSGNINKVCSYANNNAKGVLMGIYDRGGKTIICTWKLSPSNSASYNTGVSKQIKIDAIAKAMKEGFVQYPKGNNEYACAFKPEFLYFYLRNSDWLHTGKVEDISNHSIPQLFDGAELPYESEFAKNRIIFGAPGTGKSFKLNQEKSLLLKDDAKENYERVTFHPEYSYANFVGTYKPVPYIDSQENDAITYKYVPGPFMRILANAIRSVKDGTHMPFLLIIEEINRANVAAVFGDVFQLLDRNKNGYSEYSINASEDMKKYLADELGGTPEEFSKIRIPGNMFIWATMNSADQGVFPMDTAFKRRWNFDYIGINTNEEGIQNYKYNVAGKEVEWNKLRKAINKCLIGFKLNEDKLLGPYFIPKDVLDGTDEDFINAFVDKVLMYLFDDAAKHKHSDLFETGESIPLYSDLRNGFRTKGVDIFKNLDYIPTNITANGTSINGGNGNDGNDGSGSDDGGDV